MTKNNDIKICFGPFRAVHAILISLLILLEDDNWTLQKIKLKKTTGPGIYQHLLLDCVHSLVNHLMP